MIRGNSMEYKILDGKATAARLRADIASKVQEIVAQGGKRPCLIAVLVGENPASVAYVSNKEKACAEVGFESQTLKYPADITQDELIAEINKLNTDEKVDGIIVQLPLPEHINPDAVIASIDPAKDVDGFHPVSAGKLMLGLPTFLPATPMGIVTLLKEYNIHAKNRNGFCNLLRSYKLHQSALVLQDASVCGCFSCVFYVRMAV